MTKENTGFLGVVVGKKCRRRQNSLWHGYEKGGKYVVLYIFLVDFGCLISSSCLAQDDLSGFNNECS